jgi:hypothetical protein
MTKMANKKPKLKNLKPSAGGCDLGAVRTVIEIIGKGPIGEALEELLFKDDSALAKEITQALAKKAQKGDAKAAQLEVRFLRLIGSRTKSEN